MTNKHTLNLSTVIYLTTLATLFILKYLNGGLTSEFVFLIFIVTSVPFLLITRKFYLATPIISIFFLMLTIATLPNSVYLVTGEEPSFIISSATLGFLLTLLIANQINHAEWGIKSPWIANILGLIGLYISEYILLLSTPNTSQIIIGAIGFLIFMIISTSFLTIGKYVFVHKPRNIQSDSIVQNLTDEITNSSYLHVKTGRRSEQQFTVLDKNSKYNESYRLYFTDETIYYDNDLSDKKQFKMIKNNKEKMLYSWFLNESTRSDESKKTKEIKSESFIVVTIDDTYSEGLIETWAIKRPRSQKYNLIGHMIIDGKDKKKFINKFNELIVELSLKKNGY